MDKAALAEFREGIDEARQALLVRRQRTDEILRETRRLVALSRERLAISQAILARLGNFGNVR